MTLVIGFDSEWVFRPDLDKNHILSYQFAGKTAAATWTGVIFTNGSERKHRLTLRGLIGRAIEAGRAAGVLERRWPAEIYATAHFTRADLASFRDYPELKLQFDNVRGSYTTVGAQRPYNCTYVDRNRHSRNLTIHLRDTQHLCPGGTKLETLGALHGLNKIELPPGMIARMDALLEQDPALFEAYAIRDAEIAAEHLWYMIAFAQTNRLATDVPTTLGGMAVRHLQNIWQDNHIVDAAVLGNERIREQVWNRRNRRYYNRERTVPIRLVHENLPLATESYHGGRNEAFTFGFTGLDFWFDYDLSAAYSTGLAAIQTPDWNNMQHDLEPTHYTVDCLGIARIRFKFPADTRFPSLPVRSDHGLIFPLEGETHAGSPEIQLALALGAEIDILNGWVVPWASDVRPFEMFSRNVRQHRDNLEKGSVDERTWKEIGNSVYGKLAQGLRERRVYDSRTGTGAVLPPSAVTQAYLAGYTTSFIRAVLGELLNNIPPERAVISVTTDGFITNAPKDELDVSGPLSRMFADLTELMAGKRDFLETKHYAPSVLCFKTRGQLTVGVLDPKMPTITAKAGHKPPDDVLQSAKRYYQNHPAQYVPEDLKDTSENDWLLQLFLERDPSTSIPVWSFVSMREMARSDLDIIRRKREQQVNFEYDWKRELIEPQAVLVGRNFAGTNHVHLSLHSRPWASLQAFQKTRERFDEWRTKHKGLLKTLDDWSRWQAFQQQRQLRHEGKLTGKGAILDQAKRMFLKAYANKLWELPGGNYAELAEWLTTNGYPTSETDIKNAKRSRIDAEQLPNVGTPEVEILLDVLRRRYTLF